MYDGFACLYHCRPCTRSANRAIRGGCSPLGLTLNTSVSYHIGSRNPTGVLWKNSQRSSPLSDCSSLTSTSLRKQESIHQCITLSTRLYLRGFTEIASLLHVPGLIQYSASTQSPLHGWKPEMAKEKISIGLKCAVHSELMTRSSNFQASFPDFCFRYQPLSSC